MTRITPPIYTPRTTPGAYDVGYVRPEFQAISRALAYDRRKLGDFMSVWDFNGIKGNGTYDDSVAFQSAVASGQTFIVPPAQYIAGNLSATAGTGMIGLGWGGVVTKADGAAWLFSVNPGSGGSSDPTTNIQGVMVANLWLKGLSDEGFDEHTALINANAVSDLMMDWLKLTDFEGDSIYAGSGNVNGIERHNQRITLRNSLIDGVNYTSRNGVSVIDCDTFLVDNVDFRRIGIIGEPGCIDFEPDNDFNIIRNARVINSRFTDCPNIAAIECNLRPNSTQTTAQEDFQFIGNRMTGCKSGFGFSGEQGGAASASTPAYDVVFAFNRVTSCTEPALVDGAQGMDMTDNIFRDCPSHMELGYGDGVPNYDLHFDRNRVINCGATSTDAIWIRTMTSGSIRDNEFDDNGVLPAGSGGRHLHFVGANVGTAIQHTGNVYASSTGRTNVAILIDPAYTLDHDGSDDSNNTLRNGLTGYDFLARGSKTAGPPVTGTWTSGATTEEIAPVSGGYREYVYNPGTASWKSSGLIT